MQTNFTSTVQGCVEHVFGITGPSFLSHGADGCLPPPAGAHGPGKERSGHDHAVHAGRGLRQQGLSEVGRS